MRRTPRSVAKYTERSLRRSRVKFPRRNGESVAVFQATKGVRCACEQSRGSAIVKRPLCNYVIARSDSICRAVAIPRKGTARLKSLVATTVLQSISIVCAYSSALWGNTPTAPLPRPPTPHRQGRFSGSKDNADKDTFYNSARNEICLTANEILLCKMKSDKSDDISLREVAVVQSASMTLEIRL